MINLINFLLIVISAILVVVYINLNKKNKKGE